ARGGSVRTGAAAMIELGDAGVAAVSAGGERWVAPSVIAAVPWFAIPDLFAGDPPALADLLRRARGTDASPIVTVNLWLGLRAGSERTLTPLRPLLPEPFVGLPGRAMQWVFN